MADYPKFMVDNGGVPNFPFEKGREVTVDPVNFVPDLGITHDDAKKWSQVDMHRESTHTIGRVSVAGHEAVSYNKPATAKFAGQALAILCRELGNNIDPFDGQFIIGVSGDVVTFTNLGGLYGGHNEDTAV